MQIQDTYIETFRRTQETWADVVKSFTNNAPWTLRQRSPLFGYLRSQQVHRPVLRLLGAVPRSPAHGRKTTGRRHHLRR